MRRECTYGAVHPDISLLYEIYERARLKMNEKSFTNLLRKVILILEKLIFLKLCFTE